MRGVSGTNIRLQTVPKRFYADVPPTTDFIFRPVCKLRDFASGILHIHRMNMSLSLTFKPNLILTLT